MGQIMGDRFILEKVDGPNCGDPYCTGHPEWYIMDTKTGKTLRRYREPIIDRIEELNFIAECIEETSF